MFCELGVVDYVPKCVLERFANLLLVSRKGGSRSRVIVETECRPNVYPLPSAICCRQQHEKYSQYTGDRPRPLAQYGRQTFVVDH